MDFTLLVLALLGDLLRNPSAISPLDAVGDPARVGAKTGVFLSA